jgi:hypothetical protein
MRWGDRRELNAHFQGHNLAGYRYPTATVDAAGFEPTTSTVSRWRSTAEPSIRFSIVNVPPIGIEPILDPCEGSAQPLTGAWVQCGGRSSRISSRPKARA